MNNPWQHLPGKAPYVLPGDNIYVDVHNQQHPTGDLHIRTDLLPEPFLGDVMNAPIVLLQANGSCGNNIVNAMGDASARGILMREMQSADQPHSSISDHDNSWWNSACSGLMNGEYPISRECLAKQICSIEFFPYRSSAFSHSHIRVPSQDFTFELVREAIRRQAIIIVARCWKEWQGAVPELYSYSNRITSKLPRRVYISEKGLGVDEYEKVRSAIRC